MSLKNAFTSFRSIDDIPQEKYCKIKMNLYTPFTHKRRDEILFWTLKNLLSVGD